MSKSLDFCQVVASDPELSAYAYRDWFHAVEEDSEPYFDKYLEGNRSVYVDTTEGISGEPARFGLEITIDPDGEFTYYTSSNFVSYGELEQEELRKILLADIDDCVNRVMSVCTYDTVEGRPKNGDTVHYTIGNFVILCEHEINRDRHEITVLLPIKTKILREGIM